MLVLIFPLDALTELALLILEWFPDLHDIKNEKGLVPLHVLAEKPGAFRSGTYLSLFDRLIYDCKNLSHILKLINFCLYRYTGFKYWVCIYLRMSNTFLIFHGKCSDPMVCW